MSVVARNIVVNPENQWRIETPGSAGWARSPRAGDAKPKYFMISVDAHLTPPKALFAERIEERFRDRLPRIEVRDGAKYLIQEGVRAERLADFKVEGEDQLRVEIGASAKGAEGGDVAQHLHDEAGDSVDGDIIFPNGAALLLFASRDPEFVMAQCRVWNDWAFEATKGHHDRAKPIAAIGTADVALAVAEVKRIAKMGYQVITLPNKPIFGPHDVAHPNYNLPLYDPLWAAIEETDLPITFHVSTGGDPRSARGNGGAIINYCIHSLSPTIEPVVNLCASGVIERFPGVKFATIEANGGWVPWLLDRMDEAYHAHHFWVRPKLKNLPSDYFRSNGAASVGEDHAALLLAEPYCLQDNFMWANDYPHHEGSWPHSPESIERTFGALKETTRAKILGLNAARMFKFEIPKGYVA